MFQRTPNESLDTLPASVAGKTLLSNETSVLKGALAIPLPRPSNVISNVDVKYNERLFVCLRYISDLLC